MKLEKTIGLGLLATLALSAVASAKPVRTSNKLDFGPVASPWPDGIFPPGTAPVGDWWVAKHECAGPDCDSWLRIDSDGKSYVAKSSSTREGLNSAPPRSVFLVKIPAKKSYDSQENFLLGFPYSGQSGKITTEYWLARGSTGFVEILDPDCGGTRMISWLYPEYRTRLVKGADGSFCEVDSAKAILKLFDHLEPYGSQMVYVGYEPTLIAGSFISTLPAPKKGSAIDFSIPAGPADQALNIFQAQSGARIVATSGDLTKSHTNAVVGRMDPSTALLYLLDKSGLAQTKSILAKDGELLFVGVDIDEYRQWLRTSPPR